MLATYILNLGAEIWGKKWRAAVLWFLRSGDERRFSELKRELNGCSVKVLSEVLKELEANRLILRVQYPTIPVKVTYQLHPDFQPIMLHMENYVDEIGQYFFINIDNYKFPKEVYDELMITYGSK